MSTNTTTATPCVDQLLEMAREGLIDPLDLLTSALTYGGEDFARELCDAADIEWQCNGDDGGEDPDDDAPYIYDDPAFADSMAADWAAARTAGPR